MKKGNASSRDISSPAASNAVQSTVAMATRSPFGQLVESSQVIGRSGVKPGTKIRLKGMGLTEDKKSGDLYLRVKVKD